PSFPYTTLFRSGDGDRVGADVADLLRGRDAAAAGADEVGEFDLVGEAEVAAVGDAGGDVESGAGPFVAAEAGEGGVAGGDGGGGGGLLIDADDLRLDVVVDEQLGAGEDAGVRVALHRGEEERDGLAADQGGGEAREIGDDV